jgi:hypothetical protein
MPCAPGWEIVRQSGFDLVSKIAVPIAAAVCGANGLHSGFGSLNFF